MNGIDKSSNDLQNDWSDRGVSGIMKLSVTVYKSAKVPNVATVFSKTYKGRILNGNSCVQSDPLWLGE